MNIVRLGSCCFTRHRCRAEARHWLAYRRWHGAVWGLDELKEAPEQISQEQLRRELEPYKKSTFCICDIA